ncbi:hypothetical protein OBBRIDRAFT_286375 [Obba rivulosa]|uniref:Uncharacterized protein n=1 Tax=Obba rivulosa TaxID=1052685 RepID=A0A8E2AJL5_9APHY|nr:hypothetical protein OBBRIDRAFT_286375 [Obba rivulosa]
MSTTMLSKLRCISAAQATTIPASRHLLSTSQVNATPNLGTIPPQASKTPIGASGSILGFLFGFSLDSSYAAHHLLVRRLLMQED